MADDVVKTITIRGKGDGLDQLAAQLKSVADAQGVVATVSDKSSKSLSGIEQSYQKQTLRLDESARQQNKYTQEVLTAQKAFDAGKIGSADYASRLDLINQKMGSAPLDLSAGKQAKYAAEVENARQALTRGNVTAAAYAAQMESLNEKYNKASTVSAAFTKSLSGVQGQLIALSAGAGPVGVFLSALGPWGVAAAVAVGGVSAAFSAASEMAHRFADRAIELSRYSETTGLTVTQIKALTRAAAEHGVAADDTIHAVEKFTVAWEELRNGGGKLLDEVRKVDAGLADQMQRTRDAASAIELLAQAIHRADEAGNISQRNALARAAGGRGGIAGFVGISSAISEAGGLSDLQDDTKSIFSPQQIEQARKLKVEIDEIRKRTEAYKAAIASVEILREQKEVASFMERIAKGAYDFANAHPDWSGWANFFSMAKAFFGIEPEERKPLRINIPLPASQPMPRARPTPGDNLGDLSPGTVASQWRNYVSALGSAATASDHLQARTAQLYADFKDNKITADAYWKAVGGENFQMSMQALNARVGLLGQMAPLTDLATAAQNRLVEAQKHGARFSGEEKEAILSRVAVERQSADNAVLIANNVATAEGLRKTKLAELNQLVREHKLTQDQATTSLSAYERVIKETIQQQEIARSKFPQMKAAEIEAGDALKQWDQLGVSELNNLASGIVTAQFSTDKWSVSLRNLGISALKMFDEMIVKMLIMQTLSPVLQGVGSGGSGLLSLLGLGRGPGTAGNSMTGIAGDPTGGGIVVTAGHTGGVVGSLSMLRSVHSSVFADAPRFHTGGLVGGEVPIIAKRGEGIFTQQQMAAMGMRSNAPQPLHITVSVSGARGSKEISDAAEAGANRAIAASAAMLHDFSVNQLPGRMQQIQTELN